MPHTRRVLAANLLCRADALPDTAPLADGKDTCRGGWVCSNSEGGQWSRRGQAAWQVVQRNLVTSQQPVVRLNPFSLALRSTAI